MTEAQRLFLVQARSNFRVFTLLKFDNSVHQCHILHYLQMSTELLGKAHAWRNGAPKLTHRAFVKFLRSLSFNRAAQSQLGYQGQNEKWKHFLRKCMPLAEQIEDLAPDLAGDNPNPEYPWPPDDPTHSPAEFAFPIWKELVETADGRKFLKLTADLFAAADAYI